MYFFDVCIRAFIKGNLGDDLFVVTLCKRYPNTKFVICGEKKFKSIFNNVENLKYVSIDNFFIKWSIRFLNVIPYTINFISRQIMKQELVCRVRVLDFITNLSKYNVLISGSLFMESEYFSNVKKVYYKYENKYYKKAPFILGCNFGPYLHDEYLKKHQELFGMASVVNFRDSYSKNLFQDAHINWYPDILFSYQQDIVKETREKDYIIISVLNYDKDGSNTPKIVENYINKMVEIVNELDRAGEKTVLVGFCIEQQDHVVIEKILEKIENSKNVLVINYPEQTYEDIITYIANSKYVIATRYHAMILGWLFQKNVFPIVYNKKMQNVLDDIDVHVDHISIEEIDDLIVKDLMRSIQSDSSLPVNVNSLIHASNKHFEQLDSILL